MKLTHIAATPTTQTLPITRFIAFTTFTSLTLLLALSVPVLLNLTPPGDEMLLKLALSARSDYLTPILQVFAFLGSAIAAFSLCLVLSAFEYHRLHQQMQASNASRQIDWHLLLRASWPAIAYLGMLMCNLIMRTVIARLPPQVDTIPNLLPEIQTDFQRFSFPSGHAGSIVVAYLSLAIITRREPALRWLTLIAAIILIFGVGFGRVYLGVHWPSDVAAGFLLGIVWLAIAYEVCRGRAKDWSIDRHSNIEQ